MVAALHLGQCRTCTSITPACHQWLRLTHPTVAHLPAGPLATSSGPLRRTAGASFTIDQWKTAYKKHNPGCQRARSNFKLDGKTTSMAALHKAVLDAGGLEKVCAALPLCRLPAMVFGSNELCICSAAGMLR